MSFFDNGFFTKPIFSREYLLVEKFSIDFPLFPEQTNCSVIADASFSPRAFKRIPFFLKTSDKAWLVSIFFFFNFYTA